MDRRKHLDIMTRQADCPAWLLSNQPLLTAEFGRSHSTMDSGFTRHAEGSVPDGRDDHSRPPSGKCLAGAPDGAVDGGVLLAAHGPSAPVLEVRVESIDLCRVRTLVESGLSRVSCRVSCQVSQVSRKEF